MKPLMMFFIFVSIFEHDSKARNRNLGFTSAR